MASRSDARPALFRREGELEPADFSFSFDADAQSARLATPFPLSSSCRDDPLPLLLTLSPATISCLLPPPSFPCAVQHQPISSFFSSGRERKAFLLLLSLSLPFEGQARCRLFLSICTLVLTSFSFSPFFSSVSRRKTILFPQGGIRKIFLSSRLIDSH